MIKSLNIKPHELLVDYGALITPPCLGVNSWLFALRQTQVMLKELPWNTLGFSWRSWRR